jgi:hypothetical protein
MITIIIIIFAYLILNSYKNLKRMIAEETSIYESNINQKKQNKNENS